MAALIGLVNVVQMIIMLNICTLFPLMYIMKAFIGIVLNDEVASSQARLTLSASRAGLLEYLGVSSCKVWQKKRGRKKRSVSHTTWVHLGPRNLHYLVCHLCTPVDC